MRPGHNSSEAVLERVDGAFKPLEGRFIPHLRNKEVVVDRVEILFTAHNGVKIIP